MKTPTYDTIEQEIQDSITVSTDKISYFFKTGKNTYSEHDLFLGITNPNLRKIAKRHPQMALEIIQKLLYSRYNEKRCLALIVLVNQYQKNKDQRTQLFNFYCQHLNQVNNWNLVDLSAPYIVGQHLLSQDKLFLYTLAKSDHLWEKRIAIVSTWFFIRNNHLDTTFEIAKILEKDTHDLIHKAVGWMLRETGKKDEARLKYYLTQNAAYMPRTMLRYAIEKFPKSEQLYYRSLTAKN